MSEGALSQARRSELCDCCDCSQLSSRLWCLQSQRTPNPKHRNVLSDSGLFLMRSCNVAFSSTENQSIFKAQSRVSLNCGLFAHGLPFFL